MNTKRVFSGVAVVAVASALGVSGLAGGSAPKSHPTGDVESTLAIELTGIFPVPAPVAPPAVVVAAAVAPVAPAPTPPPVVASAPVPVVHEAAAPVVASAPAAVTPPPAAAPAQSTPPPATTAPAPQPTATQIESGTPATVAVYTVTWTTTQTDPSTGLPITVNGGYQGSESEANALATSFGEPTYGEPGSPVQLQSFPVNANQGS